MILDHLKPCVFFKEVKMPNGKWKCRCQMDGSLHNHCRHTCPHFKPTLWWKLKRRIIAAKWEYISKEKKRCR